MPGPPPSWLTAWIKINNRHVAYSDSSTKQQRPSKDAPPPSNSMVPGSVESPRSTPDLIFPHDDSHHSRDSSHHNNHEQQNHRTKQHLSSFHPQQQVSVASGLTNFDPAAATTATRSLPPGGGEDVRSHHHHHHRLPQSLLQRRPNHPSSQQGSTPFSTDLPTTGGSIAGASRTSDGSMASYPRLTGKYLNEAAFVQQLEQRQRAESHRQRGEPSCRSSSTALLPPPPPPPPNSPPPTPPPAPSNTVALKTSRMNRATAAQPSSASSIKSDASPAAATSNATHPFGGGLKLFPPSFFGDQHQPPQHQSQSQQQPGKAAACAKCQSLEHTLDAAFDDIEYLRALALQKEYVTSSSGVVTTGQERHNPPPLAAASAPNVFPESNSSSSLPWPSAPTHKPSSLGNYTNQIKEATSRHRKQVEQLTKERVRWQQDNHFKLVKFANLCKDLNEESVLRNERALALEQELRHVKTERDVQAEEANQLRARVQELERYEAECLAMKHRLHNYEEQGMRHAEAAIQSRDETIHDLTTKLHVALDQLEIERAQRQRRQIIFPVNGTSNGHPKG